MNKRQLKKSIKMPILFTNLLINLVIVASIDFNIMIKGLMLLISFILFLDEK